MLPSGSASNGKRRLAPLQEKNQTPEAEQPSVMPIPRLPQQAPVPSLDLKRKRGRPRKNQQVVVIPASNAPIAPALSSAESSTQPFRREETPRMIAAMPTSIGTFHKFKDLAPSTANVQREVYNKVTSLQGEVQQSQAEQKDKLCRIDDQMNRIESKMDAILGQQRSFSTPQDFAAQMQQMSRNLQMILSHQQLLSSQLQVLITANSNLNVPQDIASAQNHSPPTATGPPAHSYAPAPIPPPSTTTTVDPSSIPPEGPQPTPSHSSLRPIVAKPSDSTPTPSASTASNTKQSRKKGRFVLFDPAAKK